VAKVVELSGMFLLLLNTWNLVRIMENWSSEQRAFAVKAYYKSNDICSSNVWPTKEGIFPTQSLKNEVFKYIT